MWHARAPLVEGPIKVWVDPLDKALMTGGIQALMPPPAMEFGSDLTGGAVTWQARVDQQDTHANDLSEFAGGSLLAWRDVGPFGSSIRGISSHALR